MPRTNVDTDLFNELRICVRELNAYINEYGEDVPDPGDDLIANLDWTFFHLLNSVDHGESYGENLELRSRNNV